MKKYYSINNLVRLLAVLFILSWGSVIPKTYGQTPTIVTTLPSEMSLQLPTEFEITLNNYEGVQYAICFYSPTTRFKVEFWYNNSWMAAGGTNFLNGVYPPNYNTPSIEAQWGYIDDYHVKCRIRWENEGSGTFTIGCWDTWGTTSYTNEIARIDVDYTINDDVELTPATITSTLPNQLTVGQPQEFTLHFTPGEAEYADINITSPTNSEYTLEMYDVALEHWLIFDKLEFLPFKEQSIKCRLTPTSPGENSISFNVTGYDIDSYQDIQICEVTTTFTALNTAKITSTLPSEIIIDVATEFDVEFTPGDLQCEDFNIYQSSANSSAYTLEYYNSQVELWRPFTSVIDYLPFQNTIIKCRITPTQLGENNITFKITGFDGADDVPLCQTVSSFTVSSQIIPKVSFSVNTLDFGDVELKESRTLNLTITPKNCTNDSLTLTSTNSVFSLSAKTISSIKPTTISVTFKPTQLGVNTGEITITGSGLENAKLDITGMAIRESVLRVIWIEGEDASNDPFYNSLATNVSANGRYVVGYMLNSTDSFIWDKKTNKIDFITYNKGTKRCEAQAVSNNGVVSGNVSNPAYWAGYEEGMLSAATWYNGVWEELPSNPIVPPGINIEPIAFSISSDGSVIGGVIPATTSFMELSAATWTRGVLDPLWDGWNVDYGANANASRVSDDGKVIGGYAWDASERHNAAIWHKDKTPQIQRIATEGNVYNVSPNGKWAVGGYKKSGEYQGLSPETGFIYNVEEWGGIGSIIDVPDCSGAIAVSDNGVIVGRGCTYTKDGVTMNLVTYLNQKYGYVNETENSFFNPISISSDGKTICGWGYKKDPYNDNRRVGWIVTMDAPIEKFAIEIEQPSIGGTIVVKDNNVVVKSRDEVEEGHILTVIATPDSPKNELKYITVDGEMISGNLIEVTKAITISAIFGPVSVHDIFSNVNVWNSNNIVTIDGIDNPKVEVLDISGRVVMTTTENRFTVNANPGIYIVKISKGETSISKKIVIK